MFIKDLQPRQTNVDVEGEVLEMSDVREFNKLGRQGKVATALIKDGTGRVKLSLWNDEISKVKTGDKVKVQKGYVGEFQGELQLTAGKFGTIEVVKDAAASESKPLEPILDTQDKPSPAVSVSKDEYDDDEDYNDTEDIESELPNKKKSSDDSSLDVEEEDFT